MHRTENQPDRDPAMQKDVEEASRSKKHTSWNDFGTPELLAVALVATALGAVGSHYILTKVEDVRIVIPAQPPVILREAPVITLGVVFFENGLDRISPVSRQGLRLWSQAFKACKGSKLVVSASASSAQYPAGSKMTNVRLAHDRAERVAQVLKDGGSPNVITEPISGEGALIQLRRLEDRPEGARNPALEAIARRADIRFEDWGSCKLPPDR